MDMLPSRLEHIVIMHDHSMTVFAQLHIEFNALGTALDRLRKCRPAVLQSLFVRSAMSNHQHAAILTIDASKL
jgi:uncharacterized ferritin-like protein (DUF455 family)